MDGRTRDLGKHLNQNSQDDKEFEGYEFAKIECSYCSSIIVRNNLLHHKNELCDKHPFSCEYCNDYQSNYEDVIHNHWPVCGYHQYDAQMSVEHFLNDKTLMATYKRSAL